jgi:hypothetical protein
MSSCAALSEERNTKPDIRATQILSQVYGPLPQPVKRTLVQVVRPVPNGVSAPRLVAFQFAECCRRNFALLTSDGKLPQWLTAPFLLASSPRQLSLILATRFPGCVTPATCAWNLMSIAARSTRMCFRLLRAHACSLVRLALVPKQPVTSIVFGSTINWSGVAKSFSANSFGSLVSSRLRLYDAAQ